MITDAERLRQLLGEVVPPGGTAADTMFTPAEIQDFLDSTNSLKAAAASGWLAKAGAYAGLVTTTEGTSRRALSDLHDHAIAMLKVYGADSSVPTSSGRTRIHQIVRPVGE